MKPIFTKEEAEVIIVQRSMGMRQPLQDAYFKILDCLKLKPDFDMQDRAPEIGVIAGFYFDRLQAMQQEGRLTEWAVSGELIEPIQIAYTLGLEDNNPLPGPVSRYTATGKFKEDVDNIGAMIEEIIAHKAIQDDNDRDDEIRLFAASVAVISTFGQERLLEGAASALLNMYLLGRIDERAKAASG